ncbi:MAG: SusC/RagA family TonB-linked outer membrane protein [Prevotella sp.]|jgi:TonB-linked SusC/RagA family outer membrane protein
MRELRFYSLLCIGLLMSALSFAQSPEQLNMAGTVTDESGEPLPGASVYIKDKPAAGTVTNVDGQFSIKVDYGDRLVFTFLGFKPVEHVCVQSESDLKIQFKEESVDLDEFVVVGLGAKERKITSVGAVTTVDVKQLQTPTTSVANLLGGRVAGVISLQGSGEPGKNISDFWVRGIGTFGANSNALVLIDGLEGDLNTIDPADIESFSVLKDASATAVYGVRGANGVVLVTTKKGTVDRIQITGRANVTLSHLNRLPKYLGAYDYAQLANEARLVRGEAPLYSETEMGIIKDGLDPDLYPNVNWQKEILNKNFWRRSYYVSGRGGSEVARYFLSLGMNKETAAYKVDKDSPYASNVGFSNYNYRVNLDLNLTKTTAVYVGADGFYSQLDQPGVANTDYIWNAQARLTPLAIPKIYSNGLFPGIGANSQSSPLVMINHTGKASDQVFKGKTTIALNQDLSFLLKGLRFRMQGAYDINSYFSERRTIQPALYEATGRDYDGTLLMQERVQAQKAAYSKSTQQYRKYHFEATLNYDHIFGKDHRTSALIYYYISDEKDSRDATSNLSAIPLRYQGVSGRFTYGFRDTYLIDLNFGYTGSENFQPGKQYGFFPSVAVGWIPTSYEIIRKRLPWLTHFKIRASYGTVGNDRITSFRFPYLTKVNEGTSTVWGVPGIETISETRIGADNLAWERAIKMNVGVEGKLFDNKLEFVVDVFKDQRNGIFQQRVQVPEYVGVVSNPYANVGRMKSSGADGNVSFTTSVTKDLGFTIRGNFTYSKNTVQNWEQAYLEYPYLEYNGFPYNSIRGYQAIGLFKDEDDVKYSPQQTFGPVMPGDIKYKDVNGDGVIDAMDKVPLTHSNYPLFMYGFGTEIRYKNFTLGVLFKGTGKTSFFYVGQPTRVAGETEVNGMGYMPFFQGHEGNVLAMAADPANRWIPKEYAAAHGIDPSLAENPNALFPRLQYGANANNSQLSTFWEGDSRYLRLQEITLNYHVDSRIMKKIGISSLDLQLIGSNLCTWDKVNLFDPEQAVWNGRKYPIPSTYTFQIYVNI